MELKRFFISLLILSVFVVSCSKFDQLNGLLNPSVEEGANLQSKLLPNTILAFTPNETTKFEIITQTEQRIVIAIRGLDRLVVTESGDFENLKLFIGEVQEIVIEQDIENGNYSPARLLEISGNYSTFDTRGTSPSEWYQVLAAKEGAILGGSECSTDEDCEKLLEPQPPYSRICNDGTCEYILK